MYVSQPTTRMNTITPMIHAASAATNHHIGMPMIKCSASRIHAGMLQYQWNKRLNRTDSRRLKKFFIFPDTPSVLQNTE